MPQDGIVVSSSGNSGSGAGVGLGERWWLYEAVKELCSRKRASCFLLPLAM